MKYTLTCLLALSTVLAFSQQKHKTENVIIVTYDGFRWQEVFTGANKKLIEDTGFVGNVKTLKDQFWADDAQQRREKLMPFFWGTIAKQGTIIGNRLEGAKMNLSNRYRFSYPGYNEIFTGNHDRRINSNDYPDNPNLNIFDLLQQQPQFKDRLAAFATWDAFPKILNSHRNSVPVFVNFKTENGITSCNGVTCTTWKTTVPEKDVFAETDTMTYHFAKEYLYANHPRVAFIGFDETDHFAHEGEYDAYLNTANMLDRYMQDLWTFLQNDPQYKDKTTLILTCDHGRGSLLRGRWQHHGVLAQRSRGVWMAIMGPDTPANGELKNQKKKVYHKQIAATIAELLDVKFFDSNKLGKPIEMVTTKQAMPTAAQTQK